MSPIGTPDYRALADQAIKVYDHFSSEHPDARDEAKQKEPRSNRELGTLDFDQEIPKNSDRYIAGNFANGSWIGKLESDVEGEEGLYNVAIETSLRTRYALIMPTRDYHPQSAPLRTPYLVHAYRLLLALEDKLVSRERQAGARVMAVYDCGETSGVVLGHKCIRFFVTDNVSRPTIPSQSYRLDIDSDRGTREGGVFSLLLHDPSSSTPRIPERPHYNLIMTRQELIIVPRSDDGFLDGEQGRWDGARLCGVGL